MAQTKEFTMSTNLIWHQVYAQSGSIAKGLSEAAMNAVDAGAKSFRIELRHEGFTASDDGIGFRSEQEIDDWFSTVGFDHDSELHTQKDRVGRFGLGRLQLMAFSKQLWRTNTFSMEVDLKAQGLNFGFEKDLEPSKGLSIEGTWYTPQSFIENKETEQELERLLKYAPIPIYLNGNQLNDTNSKWDVETDLIKLKRRETGNLAVYNMGYLVREYPGYQYGGGVVVSKTQFQLNTARNDILISQCQVWAEVKKFLQADNLKRTQSKPRLSDQERQFMVDSLIANEMNVQEVLSTNLIEDVTGRKYSLAKLVNENVLTVFPGGARSVGDRLQQTKIAFVLAKSTLELFRCDTVDELEGRLNDILEPTFHYRRSIKITPFESLADLTETEYTILTPKELTKIEQLGLKVLNAGIRELDSLYRQRLPGTHYLNYDAPIRKVFIGESNDARAWTDGQTYVAFDRQEIRKTIRTGERGMKGLLTLLVHELCHKASSKGTHEHGAEFFESFHDAFVDHSDVISRAELKMMAQMVRSCKKLGLTMSKQESAQVDELVKADKEVYGDRQLMDLIEQPDIFESTA